MTARRKAAVAALTGAAPVLLAGLTAAPASAHGSMDAPVSRVAGCFAEGPESPDSAACQAAVAASGTQAFYDWNEVNIANAGGQHRALIPDGKLCSANRDKYKGLDLARADWPATQVSAGSFTFRYRATAPHKGGFELYVTKDGYDPAQPLKWSDLEEKPFATVTDPQLVNGSYVFEGTLPDKSGRHLIYTIWQRSDSPEAFYACSDVVFGQDGGQQGGGSAGGAPAQDPAAGQGGEQGGGEPSAPTEEQIEAGQDESTVDHHDHDPEETVAPVAADEEQDAVETKTGTRAEAGTQAGAAEEEAGTALPAADGASLAQTGGSSNTLPMAAGGTALAALGAGVLVMARRRGTGRRAAR